LSCEEALGLVGPKAREHRLKEGGLRGKPLVSARIQKNPQGQSPGGFNFRN